MAGIAFDGVVVGRRDTKVPDGARRVAGSLVVWASKFDGADYGTVGINAVLNNGAKSVFSVTVPAHLLAKVEADAVGVAGTPVRVFASVTRLDPEGEFRMVATDIERCDALVPSDGTIEVDGTLVGSVGSAWQVKSVDDGGNEHWFDIEPPRGRRFVAIPAGAHDSAVRFTVAVRRVLGAAGARCTMTAVDAPEVVLVPATETAAFGAFGQQ